MKKTRKQHSAAFKAEVALAAIQERETLSELSARYGVHPTVISKWKKTFLERSSELFSKEAPKGAGDFEKERQDLYAKIGELEMQRDWLKKKIEAIGLGVSSLRKLVSKGDGLSLEVQCCLLNISKSGLYYTPKGESEENLKIMELMDKRHIHYPTHGILQMQDYLFTSGFLVNHKRVGRLMRKSRIHARYPKQNLSKAGSAQYIHPYLLGNLTIGHPGQVWAVDITYIPMRKGFMYLTAIIDVYSRYIVGWGLHNTLQAENVRDVLLQAITRHGTPGIINSDQGSQFTCPLWIEMLKANNIRISMDSKGRALDNIFIERFWRSLKQDYVYLFPCDNGLELYNGIKEYIRFYNEEKCHQGIGRQTPKSLFYKSCG